MQGENSASSQPDVESQPPRQPGMSRAEIDAFLAEERTCRVSTVRADGAPHTSALWFVWDGHALWMSSLIQSQRWANLARDPRVSALIDAGEGYRDLRGVELRGRLEIVGDVPRTDAEIPVLAEPERLYGAKYGGGIFRPDGRHAWLRLVPEIIASWDFRRAA
jgi:PPOX class probable F420-dependent enzyme